MATIVAYTYDAEYHCPDCAYARFGILLDADSTVDREGNPLYPVASWENIRPDESCNDCGEYINSGYVADPSAIVSMVRIRDHAGMLVWRARFADGTYVESTADMHVLAWSSGYPKPSIRARMSRRAFRQYRSRVVSDMLDSLAGDMWIGDPDDFML
jgi:hypothetical protein